MSSELTKARSQINKVGTLLKQAKPLPAVSALHEAIGAVLRTPLMKSEKEEFSKLITDAVLLLNGDRNLRKVYPLILDYTPGKEKELADTLVTLLGELQATAVEEAKDIMADMAQRIASGLAEGKGLLEEKRFEEAKQSLEKLAREFPRDADLRARIAELFISGELYEEAFSYLDEAINLSPDQIHHYNRIGIVLRKLHKYDIAERYFMRAVEFAKSDPNLYFNLGRVYLDWQRWDKAEKASRLALRLSPSFVEAHKLLNFVLKKQGKEPEPIS
ncbi:TPR repeat-containing protein [Solidesulfovibrio fructosivorans JJ]]|uniref:TPR repeat-containing protein n=1 Tax=Solidesulfovibrio fructosivorans JJ] TaxID=596151 RepID=E1K2I5_SOLFR|nr:tetratricopeptide repeat protein [Solidesulfovibrio fructosivorans]EFL49186.1 TPR repeat-containing protein [Solidesulfovibrio fructosivorans JJ]]